MAIQHEKLPLFGLQFHPESIATEQGMEILKKRDEQTYNILFSKVVARDLKQLSNECKYRFICF